MAHQAADAEQPPCQAAPDVDCNVRFCRCQIAQAISGERVAGVTVDQPVHSLHVGDSGVQPAGLLMVAVWRRSGRGHQPGT
jgi:hypothetical protein